MSAALADAHTINVYVKSRTVSLSCRVVAEQSTDQNYTTRDVVTTAERLDRCGVEARKLQACIQGQMELYLRWLAKNETEGGEQSPMGIILCAGKNTDQIELLELGREVFMVVNT